MNIDQEVDDWLVASLHERLHCCAKKVHSRKLSFSRHSCRSPLALFAICVWILEFQKLKLRQHGDARGGKALDAGGFIGGA
jgi:hypothetical protein